jgi:hypothetical protein
VHGYGGGVPGAVVSTYLAAAEITVDSTFFISGFSSASVFFAVQSMALWTGAITPEEAAVNSTIYVGFGLACQGAYRSYLWAKSVVNFHDDFANLVIKFEWDDALGVGYRGGRGGAPPPEPFHIFNKTHIDSLPKPKGKSPNGNRLNSHHLLQSAWAKANLPGYMDDLAPTMTLETGVGLSHTTISNLQRSRANARVKSGSGKWSSSLQDELAYIVDDLRAAGFGDKTIREATDMVYKMLDKLNVKYTKVKIQ